MGSARRNRVARDDLAGWLRGPFRADRFAGRTPTLLLAQWCFDAPPSEESSVDGPPAWSQHRKRGGNGSGQQAHQWMLVNSQDLGDLDQGDDSSSHGRPEAHDEEKPSYSQRHGAECDAQRWLVPEREPRACQEDRAHDAAHQQQTNAGPAAGKCGIKSSQHAPDRLSDRGRVARTPCGAADVTLLGRGER